MRWPISDNRYKEKILCTCYVNLLPKLHSKGKQESKIPEHIIRNFRYDCVVRQGANLSTLLLNIGLEVVTRNIEINPRGSIFNRSR
jgi:hypothetical protein